MSNRKSNYYHHYYRNCDCNTITSFLELLLISELIIKIPNHNGLSSFLYIATNVSNYLHFKSNQILKDEEKFLVKKE